LFRSQLRPPLFQPHIGQGQAADPGGVDHHHAVSTLDALLHGGETPLPHHGGDGPRHPYKRGDVGFPSPPCMGEGAGVGDRGVCVWGGGKVF
jgi:hypothetical protein